MASGESEIRQDRLPRDHQNRVPVRFSKPQVCLGMPLYNQTQFLPEALNSILAQSYGDFRLFVVDDSTEAGPQAIIEQFAARDSRIVYVRNRSRKGMVDNWKTCFHLASEPKPDYFAWVSDHDVWHPHWLESMVQALNANSAAVLVYPRWVSIDLAGRRQAKKKSFAFSTGGLNEAQRIRAICREAPKFGYMVYGLFRSAALRRCGIFRRLLFPDAILMHELCLQGEFIQVDEELWFRRKNAAFSIARQKRSLFIRKPWYIYLPWPLVNAAALLWNTVVQPPGRRLSYRYGGLKMAVSYILQQSGRLGEGSWVGSYHEWRHAKKPWLKKLKKRFKKRRLSKTA